VTGAAVAPTVSAAAPAVSYAFALGLVGVANPCGFPLLPAYVSFFVDGRGPRGRDPLRALGASACVTAGFVACFGLLGLALGAVVAAVESVVPWVMVGFGGLMALTGLAALTGHLDRFPLRINRTGRASIGGRGPLAMAGFGVVYGLASLGCSLPVFLAAVGGGLDQRGVWVVARSSVAYALGMGLLLAVVAVGTSTTRGAMVRRVRPAGRLGRLAGASLLVLSGAYLAYYWAVTLADPGSVPPVVAAVNRAQSDVSNWLGANAHWLGALFGAVVVAILLAAAAAGGRTLPARARPGTGPEAAADA
jgi:cytochrome c biogenesis protein CcdA